MITRNQLPTPPRFVRRLNTVVRVVSRFPAWRVASAWVRLLLVCTMAANWGCSSWNVEKKPLQMPWDKAFSSTPTKIVAMWTDTVLYTQGQTPRRGFAGRLMFYDGKQGKPIEVEGTLSVYAFDEEGRNIEDTRPDRKYVFTPEQFEKHYSKSEIGHSYSVWIPWDEARGEQKEISLIVRFTPTKGPVLVGEQSRHLLPGTESPKNEVASAAKAASTAAGTAAPTAPNTYPSYTSTGGVIAASHQSAVVPGASPLPAAAGDAGTEHGGLGASDGVPGAEVATGRMQTTTIEVPNRFTRTRPVPTLTRATATPPDRTVRGGSLPTGLPPAYAVPTSTQIPRQGQTLPGAGMMPPPGITPFQPPPAQVGTPYIGAGPLYPVRASVAQPTAGVAPAGYTTAPPMSTQPVSLPPTQPATGYPPSAHRALGAPIARPDRDHAPWQQYRAM